MRSSSLSAFRSGLEESSQIPASVGCLPTIRAGQGTTRMVDRSSGSDGLKRDIDNSCSTPRVPLGELLGSSLLSGHEVVVLT